MASTGGASGGGDVIQIKVKFVLDAQIDEDINTLFEKVKGKLEAAFAKQININLSGLRFNTSSVDKAVNTFANSVRSKLASKVGKMGNTVINLSSLKITADKGAIDGAATKIRDEIAKGTGKKSIKLDGLKIDIGGASIKGTDKVSKAIQSQLNKQTKEQAKQAEAIKKAQQMSTVGTAQNPTFVDPNGVFKKDASLKDIASYYKEQVRIVSNAKKELDNVLKTMGTLQPGSQAYTQMEGKATDLVNQIQAVVSKMRELSKANSNLFSGQNANLELQSYMTRLESEAAGASNALDATRSKISSLVSSSKEAQQAVQTLTAALESLRNAEYLYKQANTYGLTGAQRQQYIDSARSWVTNANNHIDAFNNAGYSQTVYDLKEVKNLINELNKMGPALTNLDGNALKSTDQLHSGVQKLIADLDQLQAATAKFNNADLNNKIASMREAMVKALSAPISQKDLTDFTAQFKNLKIEGNALGLREKIKQEITGAFKDVGSLLKGSLSDFGSLWSSLKNTTPGTTAFDGLKVALQGVQEAADTAFQKLQQLKSLYAGQLSGPNANPAAVQAVKSAEAKYAMNKAAADEITKAYAQAEKDFANLAKIREAGLKALRAESISKRSNLTDTQKAFYTGLYDKYKAEAQKEFEKFNTLNPIGLSNLSKQFAPVASAAKDVDKIMSKLNNTQTKSAASAGKLQSQYQSLLNVMQRYQQNTPRLQGKQLGGELNTLITQTQDALNVGNLSSDKLNAIRTQFNAIQQAARGAGLESKTFGDNLKNAFQNFAGWFSASMLMMRAWEGIKQMVDYTKQLDTSMTELKKVTDESDATYSRFLDDAAAKSVNIGAKLTDVVDSTAEFARLGYDIKESLDLSEAAITLKNVGDGIESASDASEKIISTMKAFDIAPDKAMSEIVDKYNEVGVKTHMPISKSLQSWRLRLVNDYNGQ